MLVEVGDSLRKAGRCDGLFGAYPLGWDDPRRPLVNCYNDGGEGAGGGAAAGAGAAGGNGSGAGAGAGKPASGLTLTQEDLDDIIAKRLARERSIWERRSGQNTEEREELDRLRKAEQERQQREAEAKGEWDRLKQSLVEKHTGELTEREKRLDRATGELRTERIRRALVSAAARHGAIDPEEVADLLERRCTLDEDYKPVVNDENGQRAYRGGDPLTPEQLVEGYLSKKPHLVRAGNTGQGGGSKGGASVTNEAGPTTPELQQAREQYAELKKQAATSGTIQDATALHVAGRKVKELEARLARR